VLLTLRYILVTILSTWCTYALVYVHFVYLYCPISLLHACVSQVTFNTCTRVWERIGSGVFLSLFMVGACCWCGRLCFGRGRDRRVVLYNCRFLWVLGWWVGVCLYTRVHTHKLLRYLMWAQVCDVHLESQKNPDRLKHSIHVDRIGVQSTSSLSRYMLGCGFWWSGLTAFFF